MYLSSGAFWLSIVLLWFILSLAYRRARGKPLVATVSPRAVFVERWASARIGSGLISKLSTARNCMHVQVTDTELHIHPHFPFTLGFMPEIYGLDLTVPLDRVSSATILGGRYAKAVEVIYRTPAGGFATTQLLLRNSEAFVRAALVRQCA